MATDIDAANKARSLWTSCGVHHMSYLLTCNFDDLQESVRCAARVRELFHLLLPLEAYLVPVILYQLARPLTRRFLHTRQVEDITDAINLLTDALQMTSDDHPARRKFMDYLLFSRSVRDYELEGSVEQDNLHVCHPSLPGARVKIEALSPKLGEDEEVFQFFLLKKHEYNSSPEVSAEELDSQIHLTRQALKVFSPPPSEPSKLLTILIHLGALLTWRYDLRKVIEDVDEAVECVSQALELSTGTPKFVDCLFDASNAFIARFEARGASDDLDDAVTCSERAMAHSQGEGSATQVATVSRVMTHQYFATSDPKHLDAAIQVALRSVNMLERNDEYKNLPAILTNFTVLLRARYMITGKSGDLRHAIEITQRALELLQHEDPRRVRTLVILSSLETIMGMKQRKEEYARRGVQHIKEAMSAAEALGLNMAFNFDLHVSIARQLYYVGRDDDAIKITRMLTKDFTYAQGAQESYFVLGESLLEKSIKKNNKEALDEAILTARRLIELVNSKPDDLLHARILLGTCLYHRYKSTENEADIENSLAVLEEGFQMSACAPIWRIMAGQPAIDILCELAEWGRAHKISQQIVDLITLVSSRSLDCTDKQYWLQAFSHQVPTYVSIALQARCKVSGVIDMLETCRGSIFGHMIDSRIDLTNLKEKAPKEAERFAALRDEINGEIDWSGNVNRRVEVITRRNTAEAELRACLEDIRKLEGFHRFLLGPALSDLKAAAAHGPIIVVNITSIRSDAIIVTEDAEEDFDLLPLPELKYEEVVEYQTVRPLKISSCTLVEIGLKNQEYLKLLKLLWVTCVKSIFQKLDNPVPRATKRHIWWLGIGIANTLPFHAAGIYPKKAKEVLESALFRVISSYTPSFKFLMHGRKLKNDRPNLDVQGSPSKPEMLIVEMPTTPGEEPLEGVQDEVEKVQNIVGGSFSVKRRLHPDAKEVKEGMEKCPVVHFACHGLSILTDPLGSHLLLQKTTTDSAMPVVDKLTVRDVTALNLNHGTFAFLSACSTAENRHIGLLDEGLHLASAFWVAGYLHTVGNLWPADDDVSVPIVEGFYRHLLEEGAGEFGNGENVAKALNESLIDILKKKARQPLSWVQFVHFGI